MRQTLSLYLSVKKIAKNFENCKNKSRDGENAMNDYKNQLRVEIECLKNDLLQNISSSSEE